MNASTKTTSSRPRHLSFSGGCNFRDIGGYPARNGREVRWGRVYRAGVLSYFTSEDHAALNALGVRAICDLRRTEEREREPTRWPDVSVHGLSWGDDEIMPTIRSFAARHAHTPAGMREAMIDLYRALPTWMGSRIGGFLDCIVHDRVPLVVHCAAGKDRTGVAIAVLLRALGVERDTIIEDYLLTNAVAKLEEFILERQHSHLGLADAHHPLLSMPEDIRNVLFSADADYLAAAFDVIDERFGTIESYLASAAQIDAAKLAQLREKMLS